MHEKIKQLAKVAGQDNVRSCIGLSFLVFLLLY